MSPVLPLVDLSIPFVTHTPAIFALQCLSRVDLQILQCCSQEGMQSESGNPSDALPAHADGTTPSIAHKCGSPFCRNPVGVRGGGANFFLSGQHIE
ncbi:hypothetical protein AHAS_Ahas14G0191500 [Arachis hypogaea]